MVSFKKRKGFTLVEIIVVIAIIGIISSLVLVVLSGATVKARDTKRKAEISQMGKILSATCYLPNGGEGEYDLVFLAEELVSKDPKYEKFLSQVPRDPKTGTDSESKYFYIVNSDGSKCALYANLENSEEPVNLIIDSPTPGGGKGVLKSANSGWNGTFLYFQYSN